MLITIDDNANDINFQNIFLGIYALKSKRYFQNDDIFAFNSLAEHTTSKKDKDVRRMELLKIINGPLEKFYEEHMHFYLMDIVNNPLMAKVIQGRIELGNVKDSDAVDDLFR